MPQQPLKFENYVSVRDGIQNAKINSHTHNWLRVPAIQMAKPRPLPTFSPQAFADPPPPPSAPPAGGGVRTPPVLSSLYPADDCGSSLSS